VQRVAPPEAASNVAAPMAKAPEMAVPDRTAKPKSANTKPVEKPVDKSSSRQPRSDEQIATGATRVETGAQAVPFGGLASSGGGGTGMTVDLKNFCCPAYLQQLIQKIQSNWKQNLGADGRNTVTFTILRDGRIVNVAVSKPSNNPLLDLESRRAVLYTQRLAPLPAEYPNPTFTVDLVFIYRR